MLTVQVAVARGGAVWRGHPSLDSIVHQLQRQKWGFDPDVDQLMLVGHLQGSPLLTAELTACVMFPELLHCALLEEPVQLDPCLNPKQPFTQNR